MATIKKGKKSREGYYIFRLDLSRLHGSHSVRFVVFQGIAPALLLDLFFFNADSIFRDALFGCVGKIDRSHFSFLFFLFLLSLFLTLFFCSFDSMYHDTIWRRCCLFFFLPLHVNYTMYNVLYYYRLLFILRIPFIILFIIGRATCITRPYVIYGSWDRNGG